MNAKQLASTALRTIRTGMISATVFQLAIGSAFAAPLSNNQSSRDDDTATPIKHVIVIIGENRSFDHLLGWHPTANGRQAGLSYPDELGALIPTAALAPDYTGCGHPDPDHSWAGSRVSYAGGAMNGGFSCVRIP